MSKLIEALGCLTLAVLIVGAGMGLGHLLVLLVR